MAFPAEGISKFRYGQIVAAALSHLVSEQGHAVGLMTMERGKLAYVPSRGGRQHLRALLARIDRLEPEGAWDPAHVIARGAQLLQRRGVVIVVSDFYDNEDATRREVRRIARHGHDVAMLHVLSPAELKFPYSDHLELEDLESGERRLIDAVSDGAKYATAMRAFLDRSRTNARRDGVDYALISTDTPPEVALREYLLKRSRGHEHDHAPRVVSE